MLSRTLPLRLHHAEDPPQDPVLHVQHRVPLHDDVHPHGARVLHAPRLWREDRPGRHRHPRLLRLHVGHRGEDAGDKRVHTIDRSDC